MENKTFKEFLISVEFGFLAVALIFVIVTLAIPMESNIFLNEELKGINAHRIYRWIYSAFMCLNFLLVCFVPSVRKIESTGDLIGVIFLIAMGPFTIMAVAYRLLWKRYYKNKNKKDEK